MRAAYMSVPEDMRSAWSCLRSSGNRLLKWAGSFCGLCPPFSAPDLLVALEPSSLAVRI